MGLPSWGAVIILGVAAPGPLILTNWHQSQADLSIPLVLQGQFATFIPAYPLPPATSTRPAMPWKGAAPRPSPAATWPAMGVRHPPVLAATYLAMTKTSQK
jgi:hypothetical protein